MIRATCGVKLIEKRGKQDLEETLDKISEANEVRSYGHVWRRSSDDA